MPASNKNQGDSLMSLHVSLDMYIMYFYLKQLYHNRYFSSNYKKREIRERIGLEDLQIKCNTPVAITMTEESVAFTMTENQLLRQRCQDIWQRHDVNMRSPFEGSETE